MKLAIYFVSPCEISKREIRRKYKVGNIIIKN